MASISVQNFYENKSVFITGGTGFIGKVLIEKLLRTCSKIGTIYVLLRPNAKDGSSNAQERLRNLISKSQLFQFHREKLDFSKVVAVDGDLAKPQMGLTPANRKLLMENVSVVFHSAASVRFHGPIKDFIAQNVYGTEKVLQLCHEMARLESVVYVSTAYANCNLLQVEEKVYPLQADNVNTVDEVIDSILAQEKTDHNTPKFGDPILMGRPNSYTLSKAITESLIVEKYAELPVVICRPSIVTHACNEPIDGWCDSFNGLAGTLILGGLGIARTMDMNCDYKADIIPVDFVVNSLIVMGAHTALNRTDRKQVVHISSGFENPITWGQILNYTRDEALNKPSEKLVRPIAKNPIVAKNRLGKAHHLLIKLISHYLFAYLVDLVIVLTGNKRFMVRVTKKMHRAFDVLEHFTSREWIFVYKSYLEIFKQLSTEEQQLFQSNVATINWSKYCSSITMGCRRYLLKEDDSSIERSRKRQTWITIGYAVFKLLLIAILIAIVLFTIVQINQTLQPQ